MVNKDLKEVYVMYLLICLPQSYKSAVFSDNIRPIKIMEALHYLMQNSDLYQQENIQIDHEWMQKFTTKGENETFNYKIVSCQSTNVCIEASTENSETNQDIDNSDEEVNAPSFHTMLDNQHVDHNNVFINFCTR